MDWLAIGMTLLVACLAGIFRSEYDSCMPWLTKQSLKASVRLLPQALRERFEEEWSAYLNDIPGLLPKFLCTIGFLIAGAKIRTETFKTQLAMSIDVRSLVLLASMLKPLAAFQDWVARNVQVKLLAVVLQYGAGSLMNVLLAIMHVLIDRVEVRLKKD